ncbi:MAG: hypothetical protein FRX48_06613 [Lasallia pustulata]|uniref:Uncharacterized protein n=1 Tax=Lasallia pustulata TaxID=136370 RepID=A0A5M8PKM7_9LECA|nr:MAG: hypothetical protein FRX48_06613 [Lasallia pustulata]
MLSIPSTTIRRVAVLGEEERVWDVLGIAPQLRPSNGAENGTINIEKRSTLASYNWQDGIIQGGV